MVVLGKILPCSYHPQPEQISLALLMLTLLCRVVWVSDQKFNAHENCYESLKCGCQSVRKATALLCFPQRLWHLRCSSRECPKGGWMASLVWHFLGHMVTHVFCCHHVERPLAKQTDSGHEPGWQPLRGEKKRVFNQWSGMLLHIYLEWVRCIASSSGLKVLWSRKPFRCLQSWIAVQPRSWNEMFRDSMLP